MAQQRNYNARDMTKQSGDMTKHFGARVDAFYVYGPFLLAFIFICFLRIFSPLSIGFILCICATVSNLSIMGQCGYLRGEKLVTLVTMIFGLNCFALVANGKAEIDQMPILLLSGWFMSVITSVWYIIISHFDS